MVEKLIYKQLSSEDHDLLEGAADCLAETFGGVQVGDAFIKEPMVYSSPMTTSDFRDFTGEYLKMIVNQGLTFVAIDSDTNRVVGALACEDFNPEDEVPVFEGNIAHMNEINRFLMGLDASFLETLESKTKEKIKSGDLVHAFMIGVRLEKNKKFVGKKMMESLFEVASDRGYKGIFVEATNPRSASMIENFFEFYVPNDTYGNPITRSYHSDPVFANVPEEIAKECKVMYKPLIESYRV